MCCNLPRGAGTQPQLSAARNKEDLKIFAAFSSHDKFAFWAIKKNGAPGLENSEMVVYDHSIEADPESRSKVEELLATEYNIEAIKD